MTEFNSPLGKKQIKNPNFRNLDIPDESANIEGNYNPGDLDGIDLDALQKFNDNQSDDDFRALSAAKTEMKNVRKTIGKERLNEGAKKRIEMLLGMSRTTKEIDIDGNLYCFQTLKSIEIRQALIEVAKFDGTIQSPFEVRRQLLARSLTMVAGLEIEQFVGSYEIDAKLELLDNMEEYLLSRLYDEYVSMVREAKKKYSPESKEGVQEVFEDLKKS